jgi:hypothetical protein
LRLVLDDDTGGHWAELPEKTRVEVLRVLAHIIANGVLDDKEGDGDG